MRTQLQFLQSESLQPQSWYNTELEHVPSRLAGYEVPWVLAARQSAFSRFLEHGFPTRREEEWKYTDVSIIGRRTSLAPDHTPSDPSSEAKLLAWTLASEDIYLMVFVNGHYAPNLSMIGDLPVGVRIESFARILNDGASLPESLFNQQHEHTIFNALNNFPATTRKQNHRPKEIRPYSYRIVRTDRLHHVVRW